MSQILTPSAHHEAPTRVGPDTYVVHEVQHALGPPLSVYINSMVIKAGEPVLVDVGSARNRAAWLEDTTVRGFPPARHGPGPSRGRYRCLISLSARPG